MTIAHRALSLSFGRNASRRSATKSMHPVVDPTTCAVSAGMTCAPWEGLYFEGAEAEITQEASTPNPELERFLLSLMSGE